MMSERTLDVVPSVPALRERVAVWRNAGERVALVPTMGALHDGHLSLIHRAREVASRVCVSVFVNPTQFTAHEDMDKYPRTEDRDRDILMAANVDLLYAPALGEMYPDGEITRVTLPGMGDCLEGEHRPGFFTGVATVVSKLLIQCMPDVALFGEKDFQQLQIIRRLVTDLSIPVGIEGVPTMREADGLALSSRNVYLNEGERAVAPALYKALKTIRDHLHDKGTAGDAIECETAGLIAAGFSSVDYLSVRNPETFERIENIKDLQGCGGRILGAAQLGTARLIDNISV